MAKILVVEETADTLNLIRIRLTKAGQVITATEGKAAVQLAFEHKPRLVVLEPAHAFD